MCSRQLGLDTTMLAGGIMTERIDVKNTTRNAYVGPRSVTVRVPARDREIARKDAAPPRVRVSRMGGCWPLDQAARDGARARERRRVWDRGGEGARVERHQSRVEKLCGAPCQERRGRAGKEGGGLGGTVCTSTRTRTRIIDGGEPALVLDSRLESSRELLCLQPELLIAGKILGWHKSSEIESQVDSQPIFSARARSSPPTAPPTARCSCHPPDSE